MVTLSPASNPRRTVILGLCVAALFLVPSISSNDIYESTREDDPTLEDLATQTYGIEEPLVFSAEAPGFETTFGVQLYYVLEHLGVPRLPRTMAVTSDQGKAYDVARGFNTILSESGLAPFSASDILDISRAYVEGVDNDLKVAKELVDSSDADRLDYPIADPQIEQGLTETTIRFTAWAEENGLLTNWTLRFDLTSLETATWEVIDMGIGPFDVNLQALDIRWGHEVRHDHSDGHVRSVWLWEDGQADPVTEPQDVPDLDEVLITNRTNYDGTNWTIDYLSNEVDVPVSVTNLANALGDAAVSAYENQTVRNPNSCANVTNPKQNWGFESRDPDCTLEIFVRSDKALGCIECEGGYLGVPVIAVAEKGLEARFHFTPPFKEIMNALGYYLNPAKHEVYGITHAVFAHEFHHHIQNSAPGGTQDWDSYREGEARFIQTLSSPEVEDDPLSGWYGVAAPAVFKDGPNSFQLNPQDAFCKQLVGTATFWGYLYAVDGGLPTIKRFMEQAPEYGTSCPVDLPAALTVALEASPGAHDSFEETLVDFAINVHQKNFTWSPPSSNETTDWGRYLLSVKKENQTLAEASRTVGAYAMQFVVIPPGTWTLECTVSDPSAWSFRLFTDPLDGPLAIDDMSCGTPTTVTSNGDLDVAVVRLAPTDGTYTLTMT